MSPSSRLVILISGSGTNLQAIIDAIASQTLRDVSICLVISNRKDAFGLERARSSGIETAYLNLVPYGKRYPDPDPAVKYGGKAREAYDADLAERVLGARPDMVVLAGFMHILSTAFLNPLAKANVPVLNLHPALPGEYDGAHAIERAHADFQAGRTTSTGVMVHYVIEAVDRGRPVVTQAVEIRTGDSLEDLENRIHAIEHVLIVRGIGVALEEKKKEETSNKKAAAADGIGQENHHVGTTE